MEPQADRMYIGNTLVWESSTTPPLPGDGWFDAFDRENIGPEYTVLSTLNGGKADALPTYGRGVTISGYTPAAVRQVGHYCRAFGWADRGTNPHVLSMYRDPNNWISWTPDNGQSGRIRHRENGVNRDITAPLAAPYRHEIGFQATPDGTTYYAGGVAVAADTTGARDIAHVAAGIGGAAATESATFAYLRVVPLTGPDLDRAISAMDSVRLNTDVEAALAPATEWSGARVEVESSTASPFTAPTPDGDPDALEMAKVAAAELARYPAAVHARLGITWRIRVGTALVSRGPASGVYLSDHVLYLAKTPTVTHLADVTTDLTIARASVVNHEAAHMIHMSSPFTAARRICEAAFESANPPGFKYGTAGPRRPTGFCRGYGMTSLAEDIADVFAWMQTDGLRPELIARVATDSGLRAKVAAMKDFLAASGWNPSRFTSIPS